MNTNRLVFTPVFALVLGLCLTGAAVAQDRAFAQDMPPVFKDTTDNPRSDLDQYGKGWPKRADPPPPTMEEAKPAGATPSPQQSQQSQPAPQAEQAELPDDPCAAYMDDYNAYTFCTDRYKKLDRMKAGTERRRATYNPPPPKTEEAKPAEEEKPAEGEKTEDGKGAKETTENVKKTESEAKK